MHDLAVNHSDDEESYTGRRSNDTHRYQCTRNVDESEEILDNVEQSQQSQGAKKDETERTKCPDSPSPKQFLNEDEVAISEL